MPRSIVRISDLAEIVPVFPLGGVILLPRAQLPLNIFEPRYLNMVDDAMAGDRLIAMVQTKGGPVIKPTLAEVACVRAAVAGQGQGGADALDLGVL